MPEKPPRRRQPSRRQRTAEVRTEEMIAPLREGRGEDSWVLVYSQRPEDLGVRTILDPSREAYVVGRGSKCDIVVDSDGASRQHLRLEHSDHAWRVEDLGSLNGTYVNDKRVTRATLVNGDRIHVGDVIYKHLCGDDVEASYLQALRAALVTDGLTQAANDRTFRARLASDIATAAAQRVPLSLVLFDVDHFKSINDAHGHPGGDRVLREIVRVVRAACPAELMIGRVGGEEFGIIATHMARDAAAALAERARAAIEAHGFGTGNTPVAVTASFGVSELGWGSSSADELFGQADKNLYAAKGSGRNRVVAR